MKKIEQAIFLLIFLLWVWIPMESRSDSLAAGPFSLLNRCEESIPGRFVVDLVKTGEYVVSSPVRWDREDWLLAGGTLMITAGLMVALDDNIKNSVQAERFENGRDAFHTFNSLSEPFGTILSLVGLWGGFGGAGLIWDDDHAKRTSKELLETAAIEAVIVEGLKRTFGRARPNSVNGPHDFQLFGGNLSFPSGHTAFVFALASTVHAEYPAWWVGLLAYGLAGSVAAERVAANAHWTSDVFFSAVLGTAIGRATVTFHKKDLPLKPVPLVGSDLLGLALEYQF